MKTYTIIETSSKFLDNLENAGTQHREFILTHDTSYLKSSKQAEKELDENYIKLYSLLSDSLSQQSNLSRLNELMLLKRTYINKASRSAKKTYAVSLKSQKLTLIKNTESQIRELVSNISNSEKSKLDASNKIIEKLTRRIQIFTVISNWILLIIVVSALINIIQGRDKISKLFKEIGDKNKQLELQKSDLQTISQNLIKQNAELERFAYVASHDLRSPGVNLIALLRLYNEASDEIERQSLIKTVTEVAENLLIKLDDLIEVLKNKEESYVSKEKLSFMQIFDKVEKNLTADIKKSKARLNFDFSLAPIVHYPKSYLESIMQNLLSNAIKYHHPDRAPQVVVKTFIKEEKTCLEVSDNGLGIDLQEHGQDIFGLYKTFHSLKKDSKGLGLYITKAQIIAMGGTIEVSSKPNVGTTFTVCFS
jgi:signal transduction histidine kinase